MVEDQKWNWNVARISWYSLIFVIFVFLVITNYRLTKTQKETQEKIINLDEKVNGIRTITFDLITAVIISQNKSVDYPQKFENEVWGGIHVLQQINAEWWFKKHNFNLEDYKKQLEAIAANCSLRIASQNLIQHWTDDVISLQFNSSKGEIIVNIFSDKTIKCKKDFWDNKNVSCLDLCSGKEGLVLNSELTKK